MPKEDTEFRAGNTAGLATRFTCGASGNPSGVTKLQAEYESFKDRLFDSEIKEKAWCCLNRAIEGCEVWAVTRYFDMVQRVLPQAPIDVNRCYRTNHQIGSMRSCTESPFCF